MPVKHALTEFPRKYLFIYLFPGEIKTRPKIYVFYFELLSDYLSSRA